jgi:hypothetical protein
LLFTIAIPSVIIIPLPGVGQALKTLFGAVGVNDQQVLLFVRVFLFVIACYWLGRSVYEIAGASSLFQLLAVALVSYAVLTVWRALELWPEYNKAPGVYYLLAVAAAKIAVAVLFSLTVVSFARQDLVREDIDSNSFAKKLDDIFEHVKAIEAHLNIHKESRLHDSRSGS